MDKNPNSSGVGGGGRTGAAVTIDGVIFTHCLMRVDRMVHYEQYLCCRTAVYGSNSTEMMISQVAMCGGIGGQKYPL